MIEAERISKRLGGRRVISDVTSDVTFSDVTFRWEPGTVTGFLGANGAGKTTTMRCSSQFAGVSVLIG